MSELLKLLKLSELLSVIVIVLFSVGLLSETDGLSSLLFM